jgi:hypothetical protein
VREEFLFQQILHVKTTCFGLIFNGLKLDMEDSLISARFKW